MFKLWRRRTNPRKAFTGLWALTTDQTPMRLVYVADDALDVRRFLATRRQGIVGLRVMTLAQWRMCYRDSLTLMG